MISYLQKHLASNSYYNHKSSMTKDVIIMASLYICGFKMPVSLITHPANLQCPGFEFGGSRPAGFSSAFRSVISLRAELGARKPGGRQVRNQL